MVGKRGISGTILKAAVLTACLLTCSCVDISDRADVAISFRSTGITTKALMPDEEMISDISILIYDENGKLEYDTFIKGDPEHKISLLKGETYLIYACVNFGYRVKTDTTQELEDICYHLAYPDEYREGIPMAVKKVIHVEEDCRVVLEPERLMSRISIRMDRSRLSENVKMAVTGIRICNCPRNVRVFRESKAETEDDCFPAGFSLSGSECSPLNDEFDGRMSGEVSLYMLENMQGTFPDGTIDRDEEKVFEEYDLRRDVCSYIEMDIDYLSDEWVSHTKPLTYRFYLGDSRNSLDVERNCHYHIIVTPEDNGLADDSWRVDKSGLKYSGPTSLEQYPADYIRGDIGERIHIGCILTPSHTPFDAGVEYMEDDKAEGIYDYEIDSDGHGATLTLKGPGRGLIYMEAGDPINDAALFIIEVNKPD